ncbi:MAG: 4-hydroxy-3-methylbut-2-enyl diphosphate reductase [Chloroflexi bacterium]|nr:4-hydroxy-3-methylbut-2-enyl diphosphate reductase [Chloroflexota bacterium]MCY3697754.1 4-hydroxy-3-methylbut-2-enyl diphosphate reductase [Chloroflexota bacterium]MXX32465.1 4-hydroxy-3-methylbut-2-enyl diphosphate reductase [Chloroflexota bacterium]MXX81729.1 4-hydroxy-3-methylbut-2-enyl diphosphate reductase [Chloroflexota bacterium]MYB21945.1 4-hydroxy-3-methylbut-2-enyl diphosphate reductase [Chloroflexota bacterium]
MKIHRASDMGFCFGVRRAVDMMKEAAANGTKVTTLGQVVHNPQVVAELEKTGITVKEDRSAIGVGTETVAITAHGVGETVVRDIEARGLQVIDTTCQFVSRSQRAARNLAERGFTVIIFGDPTHPEVKGVLGWCRGRGVVIQNESLDDLPDYLPAKVGVISQTTHTPERFAVFVANLMRARIDQITEIRVVNVLCNATTAQQAATRDLAEDVDLMIVVGGHNSANTRHLAELSRANGIETYHVETAEELESQWFEGHDDVGVTAGASTPDFSIDAVVARIEEIDQLASATA